jgi:hypothetical protein
MTTGKPTITCAFLLACGLASGPVHAGSLGSPGMMHFSMGAGHISNSGLPRGNLGPLVQEQQQKLSNLKKEATNDANAPLTLPAKMAV